MNTSYNTLQAQAIKDCENMIARKYTKALNGECTMAQYEAFAKVQREACYQYVDSLNKPQSWLDSHAA